ncbi:sigma-70 family RNA polymerase sigma factor [Actinomadura coerulea]|uniref:sigma-70 family RNA polymerase sigma factor n=1 Tax=Actinomadura coerulea TaxID=46159 RepID=UPI0034430B7F
MTDAGSDQDVLLDCFERHRPQLRAIAFRMLGSAADADDALQDTWVRARRADTESVQNLEAWLTTVLARICLNLLRARRLRQHESLVTIPDPVISSSTGLGPEDSVLLADGVGLALMIVLDSLKPGERLAFVLHDMFQVPFEQIAVMLDRSPEATRKLASRARQRVKDLAPRPDPDLSLQWEVVNAFFAASRDGDFNSLIALLHPDVILRSDGGSARPQLNQVHSGAWQVSSQAVATIGLLPFIFRVLVNGAAGVVVAPHGRAQVIMAFTVTDRAIAAIDILADPRRIEGLDLGHLLTGTTHGRPDK